MDERTIRYGGREFTPDAINHCYPKPGDVSHRALVEGQAPGFTVSQPKEVGDEAQFSSRGLTDWYVSEFVKLNHLK